MPEPTRTLRLHQDIYLPLLLTARAAAVPVEEVMMAAFRHFGSLSIEEKTRLMYEFHASPGYSTRKAQGQNGARQPYFGPASPGTVMERLVWYQKWNQWLHRAAHLVLQWFRRH